MLDLELSNSGGKPLTCQEDLIEFREAIENIKKEKNRNERQSENKKLKKEFEKR
jgi:hypothetical protein